MASKTWTLLDADQGTYVPGQENVPGQEKLQLGDDNRQVLKRTLQGGLCDGVDVLEVNNGRLKFRILPTRGMGLWDAHLDGERFGWKSPVRGPVHPKFVDLGEPSGLGWLDGFDELLVRCGLESNGAPTFDDAGQLLYPLHGRIANKPAHRVEVTIDDDKIEIVGEVEETRFHFLKLRMVSTIRAYRDRATIELQDRIENLSQSPAEMQMLYHVNFGQPLLDAGSRILAPAKTVVPRNARAAEGVDNWESYSAEEPGFEEQVYFLELLADPEGKTQVLLQNAHGTRGASLHFRKKQLPCFTIWKNTTAVADGYVTGVEPGTNFPNPRTYEKEQGRVVQLPAAGSFTFQLDLQLHGSAEEVEQAHSAIQQLRGDREADVYNSPQSGWSPD